MKVKNLWCSECGKSVAHKYVGRESDLEGLGIGRLIVAVSTLGMSEFTLSDYYYQCTKCGEVRQD